MEKKIEELIAKFEARMNDDSLNTDALYHFEVETLKKFVEEKINFFTTKHFDFTHNRAMDMLEDIELADITKDAVKKRMTENFEEASHLNDEDFWRIINYIYSPIYMHYLSI